MSSKSPAFQLKRLNFRKRLIVGFSLVKICETDYNHDLIPWTVYLPFIVLKCSFICNKFVRQSEVLTNKNTVF